MRLFANDTFEIMCRHNTARLDCFSLDLFDERWHMRDVVKKRFHTGDYKCTISPEMKSFTSNVDAKDTKKNEEIGEVGFMDGDVEKVQHEVEDRRDTSNLTVPANKTDYASMMRLTTDFVSSVVKLNAKERNSYAGCLIVLKDLSSGIDTGWGGGSYKMYCKDILADLLP